MKKELNLFFFKGDFESVVFFSVSVCDQCGLLSGFQTISAPHNLTGNLLRKTRCKAAGHLHEVTDCYLKQTENPPPKPKSLLGDPLNHSFGEAVAELSLQPLWSRGDSFAKYIPIKSIKNRTSLQSQFAF